MPGTVNPLWPRLALTVGAMIGAGTFLVAKFATERFEVLELGWFRINLSAVLIACVFFVRNRRLPQLPREDWPKAVVLGMTGITMNQLLFLYGIHFAPAIDGALLYAATPALVLMAARLWLKEPLTGGKVAGVLVAFLGVYVVLRTRGLQFDPAYLKGDLLLALAVVFWAVYTLVGKNLLKKHDSLAVNTVSFAIGALSLLPVAPIVLMGFDWSGPGWQGWLGLAYLSGMTSVVSFSLWYWALQHMETSQVAVFTNLQPPFTALFAWIFLSQIPSAPIVLGGTLVIVGVTLAQVKWRRRKPA
ncbi:MAG: DMT family transporter [Acidobacteria bacterium]|nr:DMT family transporter [Acidobacteriota bacterium]